MRITQMYSTRSYANATEECKELLYARGLTKYW